MDFSQLLYDAFKTFRARLLDFILNPPYNSFANAHNGIKAARPSVSLLHIMTISTIHALSSLLLLLLFLLLAFHQPALVQSCSTYTVQSGDTCYDIAQANGISLSDFESWNAGINCSNLQIGQQVCISAPSSSPSTPTSATGNGKVFREYIGALFNDVTLGDVPIDANVDQLHLILAFAVDYAQDGSSSTNGNFAKFWDTSSITPNAVSSLKAQHSNVKVMVSLGGDSVNGQSAQFNPSSGVDAWVSATVTSLTSIIQEYHLDGIDIDYEHFDLVSNDDFAACIGQLVAQLKQSGVISVASIAPFDGVQGPYTTLWSQHANLFDFFNFQFYTYATSTSAADYISKYNAATSTYTGGKVLASFSTVSGSDTVTPSTALAACQQLHDSNNLPGIFIWCADASYAASSFQYEQEAQSLVSQ